MSIPFKFECLFLLTTIVALIANFYNLSHLEEIGGVALFDLLLDLAVYFL